MNPFRNFGRTPWTEEWSIGRPLSKQDNTTQRNEYMQPFLERDSNRVFGRFKTTSAATATGDFH